MLIAPTIYSPSIQTLIRRLNTPEKVQRWLQSLGYNKANTMHTLASVALFRSAHCLEGALSAAAILEQHGHPPLILDLESTDGVDHTLFLYKQNGKFGTVGKSRDIGLDGRRPVYRTIEALVRSYIAPYIDERACLKAYGVLDLRTLKNSAWRTSNKSVWYVEKALQNIPHRKLNISSAYIRLWRRRFIAWRLQHPAQQPNYFPNQKNWS